MTHNAFGEFGLVDDWVDIRRAGQRGHTTGHGGFKLGVDVACNTRRQINEAGGNDQTGGIDHLIRFEAGGRLTQAGDFAVNHVNRGRFIKLGGRVDNTTATNFNVFHAHP